MDFVTTIRADGSIAVPPELLGQDDFCPGKQVRVHIDEHSTANDIKHRIAAAQALVRQYIPADVSLTEELFEMRRQDTKLNNHASDCS
jgi:hypothetical protein